MDERVTVKYRDDEHAVIQVDGKEIASLSHDADGWSGMQRAIEVAKAVAAALAKPAPGGPVRWDRLEPPHRSVKAVKLVPTGTIATRADAMGRYWDVPGWADTISWSQLLAWGPLEKVRKPRAS